MAYLRIFLRAVGLFSWTVIFLIVSTIFSFVFRKKSYILMHIYYNVARRILGLKIILPKKVTFPKQAICISNHISYLDIFVYGKVLNPVFIGKSEIRKWPVVGFIGAQIAGMFFIDRRRSQVMKEKARLTHFIRNNKTRPILFFPEGTTTDGGGIIPFKPALFEMVLANKENTIVPFRIKYSFIGRKKIISKTDRRVVAWYNDPDPNLEDPALVKHLFKVFTQSEITVEVVLGNKIKVSEFNDRGALTNRAQEEIQKLF